MKHCLNCYRKIPNDAKICHYCGAPQAEKEAFPGKKFLRCPNCMSYFYDEEHGCQNCGYSPKKPKKKGTWLLAVMAVLIVLFIFWQLGFLSDLSSMEKKANVVQTASLMADEQSPAEIEISEREADVLSADAIENGRSTEEAVPDASVEGISATAMNSPVPMTATPVPFQCNGTDNRLTKGMTGKIIAGGNPVKVRMQPSTGGESVSVLYGDELFTVLDEKPVCAEGYLWIKIKLEKADLEGWTVEAADRNYWLMPLDLTAATETPAD
ncbi:MAG TPA: zinc ribbon domain-containing protein [Flexilinea sp.]|nr:zinc ribbon domain-containing protein [Flexilinea sp.]